MRHVSIFFLIVAILLGCTEEVISERVDSGQEEVTPGQENDTNTPSQTNVSAIPVIAPQVHNVIDAIVLTEEEKLFSKSANHFAFKLLDNLYDGKSVVASPLSLQMALSMTVNGAEGETAQEILGILGLKTEELEAMNSYAKRLLEQLPAVDTSITIQNANALFVNERYPLAPDFQTSMGVSYYAPVANLPFDKEDVKKVVNDWCSQSTNGLIPEILDELSGGAIAYLLSALYFEAEWHIPFDPEYQIMEKEPFYTEDGTISLDYLVSGEDLLYAVGDTYQMVTRPFGEKGTYMMSILLPNESSGVVDVITECLEKGWTDICSSQKETPVHLMLPKFQNTSSHDLIPVLQRMGMIRAFTDNAQFSKMMQNGASTAISRVCQKATVKLNEDGIEAASGTLVEMMATDSGEDGPRPLPFHADHPFVYTIFERTSGTILFDGVFSGK